MNLKIKTILIENPWLKVDSVFVFLDKSDIHNDSKYEEFKLWSKGIKLKEQYIFTDPKFSYQNKRKEDFTEQEIKKFIDENENTLKEKIISFKYSKITPKNLVGLDEFNNLFFKKIDEIENEILSAFSTSLTSRHLSSYY